MQGLWTLFQIFICIPQSCVCLTVVIIRDSVDKSYVSLCTENGLEDDDSSVDSFRGAVPQTSLLDTSANRDKGQLVSSANRNRRPPTKRNIKVTRQIYRPGALTKIRGVSLLVILWQFYCSSCVDFIWLIGGLVLLMLTCVFVAWCWGRARGRGGERERSGDVDQAWQVSTVPYWKCLI